MALVRAALVGLVIVTGTATAESGQRRTVSCQENGEDGRILVDGREVGDARYRVLRYDMMRDEGLWSYGRCLIELR